MSAVPAIDADPRSNAVVAARGAPTDFAAADFALKPGRDLRRMVPGRTVRDRAWLAFLLAGAIAILGHRLMPIGRGRDLAYLALGLAGVGAIVSGVRLHRPIRVGPGT